MSLRYPVLNVPYETTSPGAVISDADFDLCAFDVADDGATAHWLFGGDSSSLLDLTGSYTGTYNVGATAASFSDSYLTVADSITLRNGVKSGIVETAEQTICMVAQYQTDATNARLLTNTTTASPHGSGEISFIFTDDLFYYRPEDGVGDVSVQLGSPGLAVGDWFFLGISQSTTGWIARISGVTTTGSSGRTPEVSSNVITFGNGWYTPISGFGSGPTIAEAIIFPWALTEAELKVVERRCRIRQRMRPTPLTVV